MGDGKLLSPESMQFVHLGLRPAVAFRTSGRERSVPAHDILELELSGIEWDESPLRQLDIRIHKAAFY